MNVCAMVGHICYDVKSEATSKGSLVTRNSIAVRRSFKNPNGRYDTDFIKFTAWGASAQYLGNNAGKGDLIQIIGEWRVDKVNDREVNYLFVNDCRILIKSSKSATEAKEEEPRKEEGERFDDLPF